MDQFIKSLPALLKVAGDVEEVKQAAAKAAWNRIAGEALRQHAAPSLLIDQTMVVAVADAVWQKQLEPMAAQLLYRLNALLGQPLVTYIEFRIDPETVGSARTSISQQARTDRLASQPVPFELASAAASIHDSDLRRAFLGAALSSIRRVGESG